jgi:hypothetical protein
LRLAPRLSPGDTGASEQAPGIRESLPQLLVDVAAPE